MSAHRVAGLLLAAGGSRRLGRPKALLQEADGRPIVRRLADEALAAGLAPLLVVTGDPDTAVRIETALAGTAARLVAHAGWRDGMGSSIAAGIAALGRDGDAVPAACVVLACDQPAVDRTHLAALRDAVLAHDARVVSSYDGARGIPAAWPRRDWPTLAALQGDRGAKALLTGDERAIPLAGGALDLDTPDDVARWRS
jgi:CTP:molybdopterin cytidylyltransferase MocA